MVDNAHQPKVEDGGLNENFKKDDFRKLWGMINHKYVYHVDYDSNSLIEKAIEEICKKDFYVTKLQYIRTIGGQSDKMKQEEVDSGTSFVEESTKNFVIDYPAETNTKYDLIGQIADGTRLTRRTIASILNGITRDKFNLYAMNPEDFIKRATKAINEVKSRLIVDNIVYQQTNDVYTDRIFEENLEKDYKLAIPTNKHISDFIFKGTQLDSKIEEDFVHALEKAEEVEVYAKLPTSYQIPTPVGNYSPDWAICFKRDAKNIKHIYFIAETKGSVEASDLRPVEQAKISCAKKLFSQISNEEICYHEVNSFKSMMDILEAKAS